MMFSKSNIWKRFSYTLWAPVYDLLVNPLFGPKRRRSIELLDLKAGERLLLVGAGTGLDLEYLPPGPVSNQDISLCAITRPLAKSGWGLRSEYRRRRPVSQREVMGIQDRHPAEPINHGQAQ